MTSYAVDDENNTLIRTWATGNGHRAAIVAALPGPAASSQRMHLAAAMSNLSEALWRCYTHPASAAGSLDVNTEGWRRQQTRDGFSTVVAAVQSPNLVDDAGYVTVEFDPVQEYGHRLGRALHEIGDSPLTEAVVADVAAEIRAVEEAELGNLAGRAVQAVVLSRADASPAQVAAADAILDKDPLGGRELFMELEPTAAAVAAAHWLKAAADVTAELSGIPAELVVASADDIEALPYRTPTLVLELFEIMGTPYQIVVDLVSEAMLIAEGLAPPDGSLTYDDSGGDDGDDEDDEELSGDAEDPPVRLTPLDPSRPARDLLEDLLIGIHACRLLYAQYTEDPSGDDDVFSAAVRARAAQNSGRLL
ncbi:hypothetical protein ACQP2E_17380 [Actinoplanes sp. CA-015351]|uniref:hypothetical protein n=1 Tax=Actinoplanes sp. CA-015351 TaxID=3239897 RepID=UPI003D973370